MIAPGDRVSVTDGVDAYTGVIDWVDEIEKLISDPLMSANPFADVVKEICRQDRIRSAAQVTISNLGPLTVYTLIFQLHDGSWRDLQLARKLTVTKIPTMKPPRDPFSN